MRTQEQIAAYMAVYRRERYARGKRMRAEWIASNGPCRRFARHQSSLLPHLQPSKKPTFLPSAVIQRCLTV